MKRWYLISMVSVLLTILMVVLWWIIPGFPLLIFFLFPPIFLWGSRMPEENGPAENRSSPALRDHPLDAIVCPVCGKSIHLEADESYCPQCGQQIRY